MGATDSKTSEMPSRTSDVVVVLGKYHMQMGADDLLGEGASSICRRGIDLKTNEPVAIKAYKTQTRGSRTSSSEMAVTMRKFKRQIHVLEQLMEPFPASKIPTPDFPTPQKLFLQLLDYSKDAHGQPGPDAADGTMFVVTELAQYSLKDYLRLRREESRPLSESSVKSIAKAMVTVVAGLHAKGLVHLDMKPENMMIFGNRLKLIDVDGCVPVGTSVPITDSSLSFSPCYCAPEWAAFLVEDSEEPRITISAALDVWSVGISLCELVTLEAALRSTYASYMRHGRSRQDASFHFLDWLSTRKVPPIPPQVKQYSDGLLGKMLEEGLLVCNPAKRATLAQVLVNSPFFATNSGEDKSPGKAARAGTCPLIDDSICNVDTVHNELTGVPEGAPRQVKSQPQVGSTGTMIVIKSTLWKLARNGTPSDPAAWKEHDVWITGNGSLCYFSQTKGCPEVLLDTKRLSTATVTQYEGGARSPAFVIRAQVKDGSTKASKGAEKALFACHSEEEFRNWIKALDSVRQDMLRTVRLGTNIAKELKNFKLLVKNRRLQMGDSAADEYQPALKGPLFKLKSQGDRKTQQDWFEREMWLARNGSLCYWSQREERPLVYYTSEDMAKAIISKLPASDCCRPWVFQVALPPVDGMEFAPGEFAAASEADREHWLQAIESLRHKA